MSGAPTQLPDVDDAEVVLGVSVAGRPIEAALAAARNRMAYGERDPVALAAAALSSVARSHPLADGNKRASLVLADLVLGANGLHLGGLEEALVQLAARAAARLDDEAAVAKRIAALVRQGSPAATFPEREPSVMRRLQDDAYELAGSGSED